MIFENFFIDGWILVFLVRVFLRLQFLQLLGLFSMLYLLLAYLTFDFASIFGVGAAHQVHQGQTKE